MRRIKTIIIFIIAILCGLATRKFANHLPDWNQLYVGDAIWAFMIYWLFATLAIRTDIFQIAIASLLFCFCIECSQLYQADWINALRANPLFALVLGKGFLWSDLLAYTLGVFLAFGLDAFFIQPNKVLK